MQYNFDIYTERKNTNSVKYDVINPKTKRDDLKRLWLADMDFQTLDEIRLAMQHLASHNIYGYSRPGESYFQAVKEWMREHHNFKIEKEWFLITPGIVFAISLAIRAFSQEGDGVLIQEPVYYPFRTIVQRNHREVVNNPLIERNHSYEIDFVDFEKQIQDKKVKLFILCNPHNPVGRVWSKKELLKIGEICKKYKVIVISDEIHQDFVWKSNKHLVFSEIESTFSDFTITCTSPSKTFNLAGLQISNIIIKNDKLRFKMKQELEKTGYSNPSQAGIVACEAGYRYGNEWHTQLKVYLERNFEYMDQFLKKNMPKVRFEYPQGTYLAWVDCRALGVKEQQLQEMIREEAGLWLDDGSMFGVGGNYFERFNIACPREELRLSLENFQKVFQ